MNILLLGSGGREHALAWAIHRSPLCDALHIAPGNGGTAALGRNVALDATDHAAVVSFCSKNTIGFVVIGPEAPLVDGLADTLRSAGVPVFGPSAAAAQLEGSKAFTKAVCDEANVPTAAYSVFDTLEPALAYAKHHAPLVVKADGLAAGKGVTVAESQADTEAAIRDIFDDGPARVVLEERLEGEEVSLFFLCDGESALPFGSAQDHKRVGEGDVGPNTGGMGAYSPASIATPDVWTDVTARIVQPTLDTMAARGTPFSGVLYAGLMLTAEGPKLIEYNTRFGDPECQVLMTRLESDLVPLLMACAQGDLAGQEVAWRDVTALTVVLAAKGYPGAYDKGSIIRGLDGSDAMVFHAGTALEDGEIVATGGRVLCVTATGATIAAAADVAYAAVDEIDWPEGFCRRDIGWREIARKA